MGKRIGKYELGRTLGHGNYSKVKLGVDIETDTKWAVKIIDKEQLHREHMEEQLKREIAVMKALNHDNIVQLREVMQTQNHIYLVLELSTGGELFDKIVQAKRFDEPTARRYFQQLVLGLRYAHSQGIAHRDIKPENLLLDADGALKISDFGLSNLQPADGKALLQTVCGTPNYVAPEVLKERGYNGFLADAWSCGVVLFVMLAGYLPFDDQNVNALFNKIERGDYRMARNFSEPVRDIISRLLTVDPAQRLSMDGIMDHPWFREGLDAATIQRARGHDQFVPTQQQLDSAIVAAKESETADTVEVPAGFIAAVDGLDLVGHLVATSLQPYAAPGVDATYGACGTVRRFLVADRNAPAELNAILAALKGCPRLSGNELRGFINSISHGLVTFRATFTLLPGDLVLVEFLRLRGNIPVFLQLVDDVAGKLAMKGTLRSQLTRVDPILVA